jgi:hypothetical protein
MSILKVKKSANATNVWFDDQRMHLILEDGRELMVPLEWFPLLRDASPKQLSNWRLIGDGEGIHWEDLDEDLNVEALL